MVRARRRRRSSLLAGSWVYPSPGGLGRRRMPTLCCVVSRWLTNLEIPGGPNAQNTAKWSWSRAGSSGIWEFVNVDVDVDVCANVPSRVKDTDGERRGIGGGCKIWGKGPKLGRVTLILENRGTTDGISGETRQ